MSFGLDGSFSANDPEEEEKNLKALLMFGVSLPLTPFIAIGIIAAGSHLGVLPESPLLQQAEEPTTIEASAPVSSKYSNIDLDNPVITVKKSAQQDVPKTQTAKQTPKRPLPFG